VFLSLHVYVFGCMYLLMCDCECLSAFLCFCRCKLVSLCCCMSLYRFLFSSVCFMLGFV